MRGYAIAIALLACLCCADALRCYICNSLSDPDCDSSSVRRDYLVDCSEGRNNGTGPSQFKPVPSAAVCWKQRQDIDGRIIVDRMCGAELANSKEYNCYDRVGTRKIKVRYCVCNQPGCNGSGALTASAAFLLLTVLAGRLLC